LKRKQLGQGRLKRETIAKGYRVYTLYEDCILKLDYEAFLLLGLTLGLTGVLKLVLKLSGKSEFTLR